MSNEEQKAVEHLKALSTLLGLEISELIAGDEDIGVYDSYQAGLFIDAINEFTDSEYEFPMSFDDAVGLVGNVSNKIEMLLNSATSQLELNWLVSFEFGDPVTVMLDNEGRVIDAAEKVAEELGGRIGGIPTRDSKFFDDVVISNDETDAATRIGDLDNKRKEGDPYIPDLEPQDIITETVSAAFRSVGILGMINDAQGHVIQLGFGSIDLEKFTRSNMMAIASNIKDSDLGKELASGRAP